MYGQGIPVREFKSGADCVSAARDLRRKLIAAGEAAQAAQREMTEQKERADRLARMKMQQELAERARKYEAMLRYMQDQIDAAVGQTSTSLFWRFIDAQCRENGITRKDMLSSSRLKSVTDARHRVIYAAHLAFPRLSLPQLGKRLNRDHTTILYAIRRVSGFYDA